MNTITRHFKTLMVCVLVAGGVVLMPIAVSAQDTTQQQQNQDQQQPSSIRSEIADNVCKGVLSAEQGSFQQNTTIQSCYESGDSSFGFLVRRIVNIFSIVVGAVSVIMIIIGGFRYIISGGDSSGIQGAKNTILYAIVGLVIVLFAQVIVRFILQNAVGVG